MCGAFCGLLAMRKDGEPLSEHSCSYLPQSWSPAAKDIAVAPAAAMWVWNHPLRLRKPLKRVGEKGAGQFEEVTWDEALNDIAARLKDIVQKNGASSVVSTSHELLRLQQVADFPSRFSK